MSAEALAKAEVGRTCLGGIRVAFLGIVIAIVGSLVPTEASCTSYRYIATMVEIDRVQEALRQFERCHGRFPTSREGLAALRNNVSGSSDWHGPYTDVAVDDWGEPFVYLRPARYGSGEYDLYSTGRDRVDNHGAGDDITSRAGASREHYGDEFDWSIMAIFGGLVGVGAVLGALGVILVKRIRRRVPVL